MFAFLERIEATALSRWLTESEAVYAFPGILVIHTLGMALGAGCVAAISLRLFGVGQQIPVERLRDLLWLALIGLALSFLSGLLLVLAYPTKALTNPVFYLKLLALGAAVAVARRLGRLIRIPAGNEATKSAAWLSALLLGLTVTVIVTGRLLPYTYTHLFARG